MPTRDDETPSRGAPTWSRVLIVAFCALGAALAFNWFAMPSVARWAFGKAPIHLVAQAEKARESWTRNIATAFMAGMLGPAEPVERVASAGAADTTRRDGDDGGESESPGDGSTREGDASSGVEPAGGADPPEARTHRAADDPTPTSQDPESPSESATSGDASDVPDETPVYKVDRRKLNRRLRNLQIVTENVSVVSNRRVSDGPEGIRVLKADGWFGKFGLRKGDVVVTINGQSLTTRQRAISQVAAMRERTEFDLEVLRGGESFEIHYDVPHVDSKRPPADEQRAERPENPESDSSDDG